MTLNENQTGAISIGVRTPIIRNSDDLLPIVVDSVLSVVDGNIHDNDVIGITESIVARTQNNYVTIDEIVENIGRVLGGNKYILLYEPIMSRNRFSLILRAFARYADKIAIVHEHNVDQQGNPVYIKNPFTGVNILKYYEGICAEERCQFEHFCGIEYFKKSLEISELNNRKYALIDARCHPEILANNLFMEYTLKDFMKEPIGDSGFNVDWGLLGSNISNDATLKLFPRKQEAQLLVESIQEDINKRTGKHVEVLVYGDGCFHSPFYHGTLGSSINEFADPVTSPAYTNGLEGTPNEIKIKAFADGKYKHLSGTELDNAIKQEINDNKKNLVGQMTSQGTTPRKLTDLLASLCDLCTGSGSKGTPVVLVRNYFKTFAD